MSRLWKWLDAFWGWVHRDAETTASYAIDRRKGVQQRMRGSRRDV